MIIFGNNQPQWHHVRHDWTPHCPARISVLGLVSIGTLQRVRSEYGQSSLPRLLVLWIERVLHFRSHSGRNLA